MAEIQKMLVLHGAKHVNLEYENGTGRISQVVFSIELNNKLIGFRLPIHWQACKDTMIEQGNRRAERDDDYCYRVAWRILRDWVDVQMAILETKMVSLPQIFLPYAMSATGETMFERVFRNPTLLLGDGL